MHISTRERPWEEELYESEDSERSVTSSAVILPVEGISGLGDAGKYRMGKGFEFKPHRHNDWLVITVLNGRLKVAVKGDPEPCVYEAGDVYIVEPGSVHRETALEDTEVVVINGPGVSAEHYEIHVVDV